MVIKYLMIDLLSGDTQKDSREKAVVFNPYNSSKDSKVSSDDTNCYENVFFFFIRWKYFFTSSEFLGSVCLLIDYSFVPYFFNSQMVLDPKCTWNRDTKV